MAGKDWTFGGRLSRKRLLEIGILMICLGISSVLYGMEPDDLQDEVISTTTEKNAVLADKHKVRAIRGWETEAAARSLRDPFQLAHERREDRVPPAVPRAVQQNQVEQQKSEKREKVLSPGEKVGHGNRAENRIGMEPSLQGILHGASGELALVQYDGQALSLAVGESQAGLELVQLGDDYAVVRSAEGEYSLQLAR